MVMWEVKQKPKSVPKTADRPDFALLYPGWKDKTGKYDGFAQGKPFYHSGTQETRRDFDLHF
jgi:hypothetical protein